MFRKHFNATTAVAVVALVFAMAGGAYATKKYLITSTKQISPSVLKKLKGAHGVTGATGPAGAAGPQGPAGANGKDGLNGSNGSNGKDGVSVTAETASASECKTGGTKFTSVSGASHVCNGTNGQTGFTETLPVGKSERGQWLIVAQSGAESAYYFTTISFPIPLAAALPAANVHLIGVEEGAGEQKESPAIASGECTGSWKSPGAGSKDLCVFTDPEGTVGNLVATENLESENPGGAGVSGAALRAGFGTGLFLVKGSWVVTG